jgi:magnesium-transporting ATPase (P-type)
MTMPGLLFGFSLTIPEILLDIKNNLKETKFVLLYLMIWMLSVGFSFIFQFITSSLTVKSPYLIVGFLAGLGIFFITDTQFEMRNKTLSFLTITSLSIAALLIGDNIFPDPHNKELNLGKLIAIWQILVGLGILTNRKVKLSINLNENSFDENKNAL